MLKYITLNNFKCFEELELKLAPLTLVTGINSAGKSTLIQSLLLLRQSYDEKYFQSRQSVWLGGKLVNLISGNDLRYSFYTDEGDICITLDDDSEHSYTVKIPAGEASKKESVIACEESGDVEFFYSESALFRKDFVYLYADRLEPQSDYEKSVSDNVIGESRVGNRKGSKSVSLFLDYSSQELPVNGMRFQGIENRSFLPHFTAWMNFLMDSNVSLGVQETVDHRIKLDYHFSKEGAEMSYSPLNVAFGFSYIFPILMAVLTAPVGSMIIVENPEAHLHPAAQFRMGQFLSLAAHAGIQVIVETHSDHLLNGVRVNIRKKNVDPSDVAVHYFSVDKDNSYLHRDEIIQIRENGAVDPWPAGFFDEWEKAVLELNN